MYIIIWKYKVKSEHRDEFMRHYKSDGEWVKLFEQDANYIGTDLFAGEGENEYITIDSWISEDTYLRFKEAHKVKYLKMDKQCEAFTFSEECLGGYSN
jgi:hypothetical protein